MAAGDMMDDHHLQWLLLLLATVTAFGWSLRSQLRTRSGLKQSETKGTVCKSSETLQQPVVSRLTDQQQQLTQIAINRSSPAQTKDALTSFHHSVCFNCYHHHQRHPFSADRPAERSQMLFAFCCCCWCSSPHQKVVRGGGEQRGLLS